jgi:hypothetical protein
MAGLLTLLKDRLPIRLNRQWHEVDLIIQLLEFRITVAGTASVFHRIPVLIQKGTITMQKFHYPTKHHLRIKNLK